MPFYVPVGPRGILFRVGTALTRMMGSWVYWRACRRRAMLAATFVAVEPAATG